MYTYICIYVYVYIYVHICIYMYIYMYVCINIYINMAKRMAEKLFSAGKNKYKSHRRNKTVISLKITKTMVFQLTFDSL
jgi:hypothetical protein